MSLSYFNVRIGALRPNTDLPFDVFVQIQNRYVHYLRAGDKLLPERLKKLGDSNRFYISNPQRQTFKDFVHLQLQDETLTVELKAELLRESSLSLVEEIYENPDVG